MTVYEGPTWRGNDGTWHSDRPPTVSDVIPATPPLKPTIEDTELDEGV